jgi:N-glycosylase/DNA lyase
MTTLAPDVLMQTVKLIAAEVEARTRSKEQCHREERDLWIELSCCILSSQVPYSMAVAAAGRLDGEGILYASEQPNSRTIEWKIANILSKPLDVGGRSRRYRFPNARAAQIANACAEIRLESTTISQLLKSQEDVVLLRKWLVERISGLGPKQASMFLRNVGISYQVAVIDRHVLTYMKVTELCSDSLQAPTRLSEYEKLECQLRLHAHDMGYAVGILDWAIWIVMRAASTLEKV